ncbi:MAG: SLC45 family MFS transporter [Ruminococcaceae bacterium]|nr:SLC45 family MFS transporter [Oscillospiraceae bacterium]
MKLNTKRTVLIGFAFMAICAFWQLYDTVVPLLLKYTFGVMDEVKVGGIMALDNIFALFMLPLFGALSDRTHTKIGKRMPYIVFGTMAAVVFMMLMPISAKVQNLTLFIAALFLALVAMSTFRSPAVSLMPDVTPKPLRSKGNAIINLMGSVGGLIALVLLMVLDTSKYNYVCPKGHVTENLGGGVQEALCADCSVKYSGVNENLTRINPDYTLVFAILGAIMVLSAIVIFAFVKENKFVAEREALEKANGIADEDENDSATGKKMPKDVRRSLVFMLLSVAFWYMGYNAVTSAFSRYSVEVWHLTDTGTSKCLMVAMGVALVAFVPIGIISSKIGRKKTILAGVLLLALSFLVAGFCKFDWYINLLFGLVGIAWAAINVNSFPMVVEMSRGSDIGKYTGYYYTFSMAAQVITPVLSGVFLNIDYKFLFPYATVCVLLSFVTMLMVKHGDSRIETKDAMMEVLAGGDD